MNEKCPECGAYQISSNSHSITCSLQDWKETALRYYNAWLRDSKALTEVRHRSFNQVTFWQGKFHAVKHENNQLRKKLKK